jgi:hypothetical protein
VPHWVHPAERMGPGIEEVIGDPKVMVMMTNKNKRIKIV